MVQAGARQAGERALPAGRLLAGGRPSQHLWRGLQSLAGPRGCAGGSVQGAPGPRSAPPWGPGHLGFLLGSAAAEKASVASAGLSAPWCSTQGAHGCPRPGLPPSLCGQRPLVCPLPPHLRVRRSAPLSSGGGFGMLHRSSELCFLLFSLVPCHAVGNWTAGLAWAGAGGGGRSWVWKGAADAGSCAERRPGWGCLGPQRF